MSFDIDNDDYSDGTAWTWFRSSKKPFGSSKIIHFGAEKRLSEQQNCFSEQKITILEQQNHAFLNSKKAFWKHTHTKRKEKGSE